MDYLFHSLIPQVGFIESQAFVRDRSRAVRNDFTIQRETGSIAIECHERCTRYHILSLHKLYDVSSFDRAMEIQQLMNCMYLFSFFFPKYSNLNKQALLSLREFYDDQRGRYDSPNELEMRVYHRLGLIRDRHDRNEGTPPQILNDPIFQLVTRFRAEVQAASQPITKTSKMIAGLEAMQTFMELETILRQRGNIVMIYLFACFLKYIFGPEAIQDIESIRGALSDQDIIDGISTVSNNGIQDDGFLSAEENTEPDEEMAVDSEDVVTAAPTASYVPPSPLKSQATQWLNSNFGSAPTPPKAGPSIFPSSSPAVSQLGEPTASLTLMRFLIFDVLVPTLLAMGSTPSIFPSQPSQQAINDASTKAGSSGFPSSTQPTVLQYGKLTISFVLVRSHKEKSLCCAVFTSDGCYAVHIPKSAIKPSK